MVDLGEHGTISYVEQKITGRKYLGIRDVGIREVI